MVIDFSDTAKNSRSPITIELPLNNSLNVFVMSNHQFSVLYNGHPVAVTILENDTYMVQVTYKPVSIRLENNDEGEGNWIDIETQQETYVSRELGKLIGNHLCTV